MKKIKKLIVCTVLAAAMTVSSGMCAVTASADWHKTKDSKYYYTLEDGDKVTGWQTIGSGKYYFSNDGYAVTGFKKIKGNVYYFNPEKRGRMSTGFRKIDEKIYYFGSDGVMRTGWKKIDGKTYYFSSKGIAATGKTKIDDKIYKFSSSGVLQSSEKTAPAKTQTPAQNSTAAFKDELFGNAVLGMNYDDVISKNKIKIFVNVGDSSEYHIICFRTEALLDTSSESAFAMFMFDKNDMLIAALGFDSEGKSEESFKAYAEKKYGRSIGEQDGVSVYTDSSMKNVIMIGHINGSDIIIEFQKEDIDIITDGIIQIQENMGVN